LKQDRCSIVLFGDGAANQGQWFEALNMSSLWKVPVIYVIENNNYAMGTSVVRHAAVPDFYQRGDFVPGLRVNGFDILAVKEATRFAADYVKKNGPIVLEVKTYRYYGHSMSDPGTTYRNREEVDDYRKKHDCIEHVRRLLVENNLATEEEIKAVEKKTKKEVDDALQKALAGPEPQPSELFTDIMTHPVRVRTVELQNSYYPPSGDI